MKPGSPMRIGLVVEEFDPARGGLEQWAVQFAARLAARGHEIHVAARRFAESVRGGPFIAQPIHDDGSRLGFAEAAAQRMLALNLDIVHDTGSGWHCDVFQPHFGSRPACAEAKLAFSPRWLRPLKRAFSALGPRDREFAALEARQYVDDGRLILALSKRVACDFQRLHRVRADRIRLVYNGVDVQRFSPVHRQQHRPRIRASLGIDDQTVLLLIVAHNFRLKGVDALLRAMRRLCRHELPVHLAVAGGKHLRRYRAMARRLGVAPRVTFVGPVADTVPWYAAADLYVHPSLYDACSLVVLEALASGLPVITSRQNGASELLTEGQEGHVMAEPWDDAALARLVERVLDPWARQRMGQAARRLALEHTLERNCEQIEAVYHEVIDRRDSRGPRLVARG
jgi:UDP-glucose:(heptosyl)LPS alpha-1,3-glucosyltransferase